MREKVGNAHKSIGQVNREIEPKYVAKNASIRLKPGQRHARRFYQISSQENSLGIHSAKENLPQNFNFVFCPQSCEDQPDTQTVNCSQVTSPLEQIFPSTPPRI